MKKRFVKKLMITLLISALLVPNINVVSGNAKTLAETKAEVEAAKSAMEEANAAVIAAQSAVEESKDALELRAKGSLGFFEHYGYTKAASVLKVTDSWVTDYTEIGADKDSTSLKNLKAIIPFLYESNEVRQKEGVDPVSGRTLGTLKVSMELVAIEQVQANWSATNMGHSQKYQVSENLAWGYSDPFTGWVDKEKPIWTAAKADTSTYPNLSSCTNTYSVYTTYYDLYHKTGHYLNSCNADMVIVGFAINQKGQYGVIHGQSLDYLRGRTDVMKVEEFEEKVTEYCNYVDTAEADYQAKVTVLETAKTVQETCQSEYNTLNSEYNALVEKHKTEHDYSDDQDTTCDVCGYVRDVPSVPGTTPSAVPSAAASEAPSTVPSAAASVTPSTKPSTKPSTAASAIPSTVPSTAASEAPSKVPSATPSATPSAKPSTAASEEPSTVPSAKPSTKPSTVPSAKPSTAASQAPSAVPSTAASEAPSNVSLIKGNEAAFKVQNSTKTSTIQVPDVEKIDGKSVKVTQISSNAFKKATGVKQIVIGKNVTKIRSNAFKNCGKVKTIIFKTKKLTSKTVQSKAFKGITSKTTIKVPKSKLKTYTKLFRSKGLSKKVKVVSN